MENVSRKRGHCVQPWEEFDMIAGTSTGGLIAIMLGRLRMTLNECEDAYLELSERIFTPKRSKINPWRAKEFLQADGKFDYKVLEKAIKDIIAQKPGYDESTLLKDPVPQCSVFVCATRTGNTEVAILRSYDTTEPKLLFDECKIWEACRATSAATTFFDPIKIGKYGQQFADGGVLYNNPIQPVEREASAIWPGCMESAVIVSIGTGSAPGGAFKGNLKKIIDGMKKIVTETERTDNDFFRAHQAMFVHNRLYRFNVFHGLADVGLEESKEKEKVANVTQTFLERADVQNLTNTCIGQICKPASAGDGPSPVDASDSQNVYLKQDLSDCIRSLSFKGITSRRNNISLAHQDTCGWLFETPSFMNWKHGTDLQSNNGVLWIKGHPGVGKSTLMKHTLLHCQDKFKDYHIAFYFFNARGGSLEKSPLGMLRSLVVQLLEQDDSFLQKQVIPNFLKKKIRHEKSEWAWEIGELQEFLLLAFKQRECKNTLLLIDALDECNDSDVEKVVDFLGDLSENAIQSGSGLRICLSSCHYPNIDMKKKVQLVVERQAGHDQDIVKYVQSKLKATTEDLQKAILEKARHIFIWVVLVVELLNIEFNKGKMNAMWKKLNEIPSDLDELFSKLLEKEDSEDDKKTAILVFQWVLFSVEPLSPTELYLAVLAGTDPEDIAAWDRSRVGVGTIKRFITTASRGLVEIVSSHNDLRGEAPSQDIVQFIHQSVIDFLTRNQRLVKLDPTLNPNPVGASHARLASCCIVYIMQEEIESLAIGTSSGSFSDVSREANPMLRYSSMYLLGHAENAQAGGISQVSLLQRLEKSGNHEFLRPLEVDAKKSSQSFKGAQLLYKASYQGCDYLVQALLLGHGSDVNTEGGYHGTALQPAAAEGRKSIVRILLEQGANVNTQGGEYSTALQAATAYGWADIVGILLEHGANVNTQGGEHGTALQAAVLLGMSDMVALLLNHGAITP
ncbi:uncharacterized protein BP5553_01419 [Venustampulla echinocandica]|uniref:phospholipase A2 n=1 Tax=Venustampulla echinocandica TaxID=2656787 RepID=A0A370U0X7_9HELO|nr:uncharacterized protein BP5553_01419 [Venustampulla echinocandica]RDL41440.1 hypothetical protein BP5553_01419 [Venustampulla echinocandica]